MQYGRVPENIVEYSGVQYTTQNSTELRRSNYLSEETDVPPFDS